MNIQTILGQKISQTQEFLEDGTRIPVTTLWVKGNVVLAVKTNDKDHYSAIQLGFGIKKKANKALQGQIKGASLKQAPKFLKEIRMADEDSLPEIGRILNVTEIFKPGDVINVTGISKGKGYAGVVKRYHFKGGPRTHGQSDRERAPGSIGQTTTPGRVYKGKKMAGRMGHETVTIRNLKVVDVSEDTILVKGLVPGGRNTLIMVKKVGENKKFVPLYREEESAEQLAHAEGDAGEDASHQSTSDDAQQVEAEQTTEPVSLSESRQSESDQSGDGQTQVSSDAQVSEEKRESDISPSLSDSSQKDLRTDEKGNDGTAISLLETGSPVSSENEIKNKDKEDKKEVKENAK